MKNYWSISVSVVLLWTALPVSADISETEYRSKYPSAVDQNPRVFSDHPAVSPVTSKCTTCGHMLGFKVHHFGWLFFASLRGDLARR